jgi:hypothetical protein
MTIPSSWFGTALHGHVARRAGASNEEGGALLLIDDDYQLGKTTSAYARSLGPKLRPASLRRGSNSRTPFALPGQYGKLKPGRHLSYSRALDPTMMQRIVG